MKRSFLSAIFIVSLFCANIIAQGHGMYTLVRADMKGNIENLGNQVKTILESNNFNILYYGDVATPDLVREDKEDICGNKAKLFVVSNDEYIKMLTSYGNKYLVAGFLRIGLYQTPKGIQLIITDPETINRIVFNDLDVTKYNNVVNKSIKFKNNLLNDLNVLTAGTKMNKEMEPIRSAENLREASKDMFMMVGHMTLFQDTDQFPVIYMEKNTTGKAGLKNLIDKTLGNISKFKPNQDDVEYRWTSSPSDLNWEIKAQMYSPDSTAYLLGISRKRTEAISFKIVGDETETNKCPGIDHLCAFPVEVLIMMKGDQLIIQTQREMFRMDMYFWDAGMGAFMSHANMPSMLDDSIDRALIGHISDLR